MICQHCRRELQAEHKFCSFCGYRVVENPDAPAQSAARLAPRTERRDVTILFADVIGFTAMCEQLDPEEVHLLMNECFEGLGTAIREQGGYIDKYMGDCVMALFGAPVAHEDDAQRACRAALTMRAFLVGFADRCLQRTGRMLRMRIGINAGMVVAGGIGTLHRKDYSVMGDTVNLAARLEAAAPPDSILASGEVVHRASRAFEFGVARRLDLKGKEQPVEAYELLREISDTSQAGRDPRVMPLVGREAELQGLLARWQSATGKGRWIEIRGEAGLGKTRLVQEAERRIAGKRLITVNVTPDLSHHPFGVARFVLYEILQEISGQASRPETREAFVGAMELLGEDMAPFVDALWHLAAPTRLAVPAPDPDPQTLRRMVERGMVRVIERFAERVPTVALFLDSYGLTDEASADLFESLGRRPQGLPLTFIVALRYGGRGSLFSDAVIQVHPLSGEDIQSLLAQLVPGTDLPDELRNELVRRTSGVPEYLKEMLQALEDRGVLAKMPEGRYLVVLQPSGAFSLPPSIRAAMVARIDRLNPEQRELLGQCAVQGVEFQLNVVEAVRRTGQRQRRPLQDLLPILEGWGLVKPIRDGRERWTFRQPLMQEACYEMLLRHDRRILHASTVEALVQLSGGAQAVSPSLLAYHYECAENWPSAAEATLRAAQQAGGLYINSEALRQYQRVLDSYQRIQRPGEADVLLAVAAYRGIAQTHLRLGAYQTGMDAAQRMHGLARRFADQADADRLRAQACTHTGNTEEAEALLLGIFTMAQDGDLAPATRAHALLDLAELYQRAGRMTDALARMQECRVAAEGRDPLLIIRADMLEGKIHHTAGNFSEATRLYANAYKAADRAASLSDRARASNSLGNASRDRGQYAVAQDYFLCALELWERTGDVECVAGARNNLGNLAMSQGDFTAAREHHRQSLSVCCEIGNVQGAALAQANLAILSIEEGDGPGAVTAAKEAIVTLGDSGNVLLRGLALVVLGEAQLECGDVVRARSVFEQIQNEFEERQHPLAIAGARRGIGRVAILQGAYDQAVDELTYAISIYELLAREQEATRARLFLAEAYWRMGKAERARTELDQARKRLRRIHATRDVLRADQLLRDMLGTPAQ
nr:tetratricopeptide repeat protein [Nitrospirota bacterium]